jgi:hypothetical protein
MLVEKKEFKKLFQKLIEEDTAHFNVGGSDIYIRVIDKASKLSLSTQVYFGGNFIPKSVRSCIVKQAPFSHGSIKTYLTVDENHFQVYLNYLGKLDSLHSDSFKMLLEEFSWLADEWRLYLDEHDKHDLVYVHVK